ncbi:hypothetical protein J6590_057649 [Homalodisca vitripennis]|nr:hypothetical protein J6590_057649 [Homalodisca vitripennis]
MGSANRDSLLVLAKLDVSRLFHDIKLVFSRSSCTKKWTTELNDQLINRYKKVLVPLLTPTPRRRGAPLALIAKKFASAQCAFCFMGDGLQITARNRSTDT